MLGDAPPPYSPMPYQAGQNSSHDLQVYTTFTHQAPSSPNNNSYHPSPMSGMVSPANRTASASYTTSPRDNSLPVSPALQRSGFISALPYFELRSPSRPTPKDEAYHHLIINQSTDSGSLPFPQPLDLWLNRDVDEQDWATFLSHLFPDEGQTANPPNCLDGLPDSALNELEAPVRLELHELESAVGDINLGRDAALRDQQRPLLSEPNDPDDFNVSEQTQLRRARINAVCNQWNHGFFGPRGLVITLQFTSSSFHPACSSPAPQQSRNVLRRPPPPQVSGETLLHKAVSKGSKKRVKEALDEGDLIDALNGKGETPLYRAVQKGEKQIVEILLDKGANPVYHPPGEFTPLHIAAVRDTKSILKMLIEKCTLQEIDDVTPAGETALYLAVRKQHSGSVEILLKSGANINKRPAGMPSMLNLSVYNGQSSIVKLLLEKGAFVEEPNLDGDSPLTCAVSKGNTKIVRLLLDHGASVNARNSKSDTILSMAVTRGDTSIVNHLLSKDVIDIDTPNTKGETPLYTSICGGNNTLAQIFLQKGANPDAHPEGSNSPLQVAVARGNFSLANQLVSRGADVDAKNKDGETPLFKAVSRGDCSVASVLLSNGADANTINRSGISALCTAVANSNTSLVSILLARHADPNSRLPCGDSPIYKAVSREDTSIVSLLLANKADPEAPSSSGELPLYRAIMKNNTSLVSLLCSYGAHPETPNSNGETCMEYGRKKGQMTIVSILGANAKKPRKGATKS